MKQLLDELDAQSIDMLRAIFEHDGEATTPEIRSVTGLSNSQVAYRREKLQAYDLIEVRTGEPTGSRTPPKSHSLTESAHSQIDAGLFELYDAPVTSDVEQLSTQVNDLRDRVYDLTQTLERLEDSVEHVNEELDARVGTRTAVCEATDGATMAETTSAIQDELADLQEEIAVLDERKKNKLLR